MYGHITKFFRKTNFTLFCSSIFLIHNLNALPVSTFFFSKVLSEAELKNEKSIGIPIISSTWAAFKEINNVISKEETVDVVAEKEINVSIVNKKPISSAAVKEINIADNAESVNMFADKEIFAATTSSPINTITTKPTTSFDRLSSIEQRRQYVAWFAESYTDWGFRYKWGGTNIENGIDCSAFTRFVLNYFDYKTSRTAHEQFQDGLKINVGQVRQGDLVFFGTRKEITHVAVVIKNDETGLWVVHSTCTEGIHKENISKSAYWKPKLKNTAVSIIEK